MHFCHEQECVENLFLSLCTVLQTKENQSKFMACEGFELLMRCLKEQQYAAGCTIPAINYAIMKHKACCERLIDVGGMKYVFPLLTGGGVKKALKRKGTGEKRNLEESALSIVAQLITLLGQTAEKDYSARLLNKLVEREHEKLERCVELYGQYTRQLQHTEVQIEATREALESSGDEEGLEEFEDPDHLYSQVNIFCVLRMTIAWFVCAIRSVCEPLGLLMLSVCQYDSHLSTYKRPVLVIFVIYAETGRRSVQPAAGVAGHRLCVHI